MTTTLPDLATRQRAMAQLLTGSGYDLRNVRTIISDAPLPDCGWCPSKPPREANCEIFHDTGTVFSCRCCLLTAGSVAAENAENAEFEIEITERSDNKDDTDMEYDTSALRHMDEWVHYCDLDALSDDLI